MNNKFRLVKQTESGEVEKEYKILNEITEELEKKIKNNKTKAILIHPMHFAINTPHFKYMYDIKQSVSRSEWNSFTSEKLKQLSWKNRGIRDIVIDIIRLSKKFYGLKELLASHQKGIISI